MKLRSLVTALALLTPGIAFADHVTLSFGPSLNGGTNPKFGAVGYEWVDDPGSILLECGAMFESPTNGVCSAVLSARVETVTGLFVRMGVGPAFITHPDDRLSSIFEFNIQSAVGVTQDGWDVGIGYRHYSNAGIWQPNYGRDFIGGLIEFGLGK